MCWMHLLDLSVQAGFSRPVQSSLTGPQAQWVSDRQASVVSLTGSIVRIANRFLDRSD